jgi:hypothetical protein
MSASWTAFYSGVDAGNYCGLPNRLPNRHLSGFTLSPRGSAAQDFTMRPLGIVGLILIVAGAAILALRGVSYTKERQSVQVGPLGVSAERKGFIPPVVGLVAVVLGGALVLSARRRG